MPNPNCHRDLEKTYATQMSDSTVAIYKHQDYKGKVATPRPTGKVYAMAPPALFKPMARHQSTTSLDVSLGEAEGGGRAGCCWGGPYKRGKFGEQDGGGGGGTCSKSSSCVEAEEYGT